MIRCVFCGRPRAYQMCLNPATMNPACCYGICVIPYTYTANTTAPIFPDSVIPPYFTYNGHLSSYDALRRLGIIKPVEPEEKPLEWSEVEQQLDAFMATLNGRNK